MSLADEDYTMTQKKKILDRIHLRGTVAVNLRPYTKIQVKSICIT